VKDFLADKLKSAELALKSIMVENGSLKKQIASDSEVIVSHFFIFVRNLSGLFCFLFKDHLFFGFACPRP
jgi:hypothetical protein